jgi:hypothetical protein
MTENILCISMNRDSLKKMMWMVNQHTGFPLVDMTDSTIWRPESGDITASSFASFTEFQQLEDAPAAEKLAFAIDYSHDLAMFLGGDGEKNLSQLKVEIGFDKIIVFSPASDSPNFEQYVAEIMAQDDGYTSIEEVREEAIRYHEIIRHLLHDAMPAENVLLIDPLLCMIADDDQESISSVEFLQIAAFVGSDEISNWHEMINDVPNVRNADLVDLIPNAPGVV